jgi:hypothetical protein
MGRDASMSGRSLNQRNISISHRRSVAALDRFIGSKS